MTGLALATLLRLSPAASAHVAVQLEGLRAVQADKLIGICWRESRCGQIGVHAGDAQWSDREWRSQVRLGHLDPACQPDQPGRWATWGPWGLSAASHWAYMPECYQPDWLGVPLVSAIVAARKLRRRCKPGPGRPGWCRAKPRKL